MSNGMPPSSTIFSALSAFTARVRVQGSGFRVQGSGFRVRGSCAGRALPAPPGRASIPLCQRGRGGGAMRVSEEKSPRNNLFRLPECEVQVAFGIPHCKGGWGGVAIRFSSRNCRGACCIYCSRAWLRPKLAIIVSKR